MQKIRHENDFYETPTLLTKELLARVDISGTVLEPCAGNSAISKALTEYPDNGRIVKESDLTWKESHPVDATTIEFWDYWRSHFYTDDCGANAPSPCGAWL